MSCKLKMSQIRFIVYRDRNDAIYKSHLICASLRYSVFTEKWRMIYNICDVNKNRKKANIQRIKRRDTKKQKKEREKRIKEKKKEITMI